MPNFHSNIEFENIEGRKLYRYSKTHSLIVYLEFIIFLKRLISWFKLSESKLSTENFNI